MKTTYVGTRGYQAPELLLDKPYDLACDIFSMGVVLFILITGYPPFEQAHYSDRWFRPLAKGDGAKFWKYHAGCSISNDEKCKDLLEKMLCYDPKQRITIAEIKKHPWFNGKFLEGKELIRSLRHRHREMETKRRRDARKIKDLQVSITPNRSVTDPIVPVWDQGNDGVPEQVLSNCYAHYDMNNVKEFFQLLSGLIGNNYHGKTEYEPKEGRMTCTLSKMERSQAQQDAKAVQHDYKFEVAVYASKEFNDESALKEFEEIQTKQQAVTEEVDKKENEDDAAQNDDKAHDNSKNKPIVLVVQTKRLEGDDYKFRKMHTKLLQDGLLIFNGLPDNVATDKDEKSDKFDAMLAQWDQQKDEEVDYENVDWNDEQ